MLKRLEIAGFKSFAKKTVLDFSSSVTAIVGPNGSGKCVTGDTLVQLVSGERRSIKELFDAALASAKRVERYDDGIAVLDSDASAETLVLDLKTQKVAPRAVAAFVRRTAPERMLAIETRSGKRLVATPYHPLFVLRDGEVHAARADTLVAGTRIATPRQLPIAGALQKLSLFSVLAAFKEEDAVYVPYSRAFAAALQKKAGTRSAVRVAQGAGLESEAVQRFWDGQALPFSAALALFAGEDETSVFPTRELKSRTWGFIRVPEAVDEKVARFLGYLIAEGRNCKNGQLRFVNDDPALVEDFVACAYESFGVQTTVRSYKGRGIMDAFVSSVVLSRLLDRVFGITRDGHSRTKRVPPQIFMSPAPIAAAFLSALFEGDGHFHAPRASSRAAYFEYASASEGLARDVVDLLLRWGVSAVLRKKIKRATNGTSAPRAYWSVFVYGSGQLAALGSMLTLRGRKRMTLAAIAAQGARSNPNTDFVPGAAALVREAAQAAGIKVKRVRAECPTLAAYYEERCEATRPGILRCIETIERRGILNADAVARIRHLRLLASSDIFWDEIVSVRETSGPEFVYDLCVTGDHNFIGNGIVAHNSNVAEAFRFALGEQSMKSMRGKRSEDLIWGGSHTAPRASRAAVSIVFGNEPRPGGARPFNVDFDEVSLERVVLRDGESEYSINGSRVRLRDIEELLAGANIGETGHHIISQGEADRILLASPRERREMLEDALGLAAYEFKKQEAAKKLEKTNENIAQVSALRRELAPHLRFLERQVEKLERADELRRSLTALAQTYFALEDAYLAREKERAAAASRAARGHLAAASAELAAIEERATTDAEGATRLAAVRKAEAQIEKLSAARGELARAIGRVEGALAAAKERSARVAREPYAKVPREELTALDEEAERQERLAGETVESLKATLAALRGAVRAFVGRYAAREDDRLLPEEEQAAYALENERADLTAKDAALSAELEAARTALAKAREALMAHDETGKELRRRMLDLAQAKARGENELAREEERQRALVLLAEELEREKAEALAIAGAAAVSYEPSAMPPQEERAAQEERKKSLTRMKIRLEEAGGAGEDIRAEHKEVSEREAFLARELEDLAASAANLGALMRELEEELGKHFAEGLAKVNAAFGEYFALMFGGGGARLALAEPEEPEDEGEGADERQRPDEPRAEKPGIEIAVSLPRKKVRALMQLSGGERALTSIALIFAMSQVNPPPFLILDETDAALDEANSRRYGDMIESLAKRSQLIVITHNRETMSRAGVLYGVTMGGDGVSKLLSVKFDEAVAVAK